ncbi:MAG: aminopeptidase P N-terminal domain-containing protein [Planctomycetota bacterium]|jgi:Xaa-Pro aminopeptidase
MFAKKVYIDRRKRLRDQIGSGIILLLGNEESPMNYPDNQYPFRQDSCFLYFFGLDYPGLAAVIDVDEDKECVFGEDLTVDDIIWMGPQPSLRERCIKAGISETASLDKLPTVLNEAVDQSRKIHYLPPYRPEDVLKLQQMLGVAPSEIPSRASESLIKAVVAQRSIKTKDEITEIEAALDISYEMQTLAMKMSKPGMYEREIVGAMEATTTITVIK